MAKSKSSDTLPSTHVNPESLSALRDFLMRKQKEFEAFATILPCIDLLSSLNGTIDESRLEIAALNNAIGELKSSLSDLESSRDALSDEIKTLRSTRSDVMQQAKTKASALVADASTEAKKILSRAEADAKAVRDETSGVLAEINRSIESSVLRLNDLSVEIDTLTQQRDVLTHEIEALKSRLFGATPLPVAKE